MKRHSATHRTRCCLLLMAAGAAFAAPAWAQVPVDESGNPIEPIGEVQGEIAAGARVETVPAEDLMTAEELQALVGPIALYPDDLLAIVLPASTYPLEIVQAARFLEEHEDNEALEPDESWDDSIVALLNYPEVLEMMNEDIDWTWQLGTAVANQQSDVIAAVEAFRDKAYAAGNLRTDQYQTVTENEDGVIEIEPVSEEIIYVPYYEPERVVVYQPRPAYYYYPRPYPVYYYPYPHGYNFYANYFWGVTTAFTIGWTTDHLHVFHHSYWGHPYYGRTYYPHWWYRRPSITIYNTWYGDHRSERTRDHYANGDFWRPRHTGGARPGFHRSRADYYHDRRRTITSDGYRDRVVSGDRTGSLARSGDGRRDASGRPGFRGEDDARSLVRNRSSDDGAIRFRERENRSVAPAGVRERSAGTNERRTSVTTRRADVERRTAVTERTERPGQRAVPRQASPGDTARRLAESRSSTPRPAARRETVTRVPAERSAAGNQTSRNSISRTPRTSAPARVSEPRTPPRASAPARVSEPRTPPRASAPARVSEPRSAPRASTSAPRSVSRPSVNAPRSVSRPAAIAPRSSASRPSAARSSGSPARRPAASSSSTDRRVRDR